MNAFQAGLGRLRTEGARGRQVALWHFDSAFLGKTIEVEIRLESSSAGLCFVAKSAGLPEAVRESDIEKLRRNVNAELERQEACRVEARWEDWLEVEVDTGKYPGPNCTSAGISISVIPIKRGVDPRTGEAITVNSNFVAVPFPESKGLGESGWQPDSIEEMVASKRWVHRDLAGKAYIPATSENLAALADLQSRVDALRDRLGEFLSQEAIGASLQNVRQMLPAPEAVEGATKAAGRRP